jgi:tetratricopeptide (TPR) repeat protein
LRLDAHRQTIHLPEGNWFSEGCRLAENGNVIEAIEAFRLALMTDPSDPATHFHLADCLYRSENPRGALERFYAAIEHDHDYLEAWTQIGCIHRELGQERLALDAFDIALDVHADYPDAHFHKAQTLDEMGQASEAKVHWVRYLSFDQRGPWADLARSRLAAVEIDESNP